MASLPATSSRARAALVRAGAMCSLASLAALAGCAVQPAPAASPYQLQLRSSFDLACPAAWVRVYELGPSTRGAEGCGRRLTYLETCVEVGSAERCTWVADVAGALERSTSATAVAQARAPACAPPAVAVPPTAPASGVAAAPASPASPADPFADRH
jgi:hypothetical protein